MLNDTTPRESRCLRPLRVVSGLLLLAALGTVLGVVLKRRKAAFAGRAEPYLRRSAAPSSPALIVNRWSGGGKAEKFNLESAASDAGIRVIMLERGDDIVQLAKDAIAGGADAIGAAGGDGSLGLVAGVALDRGVPFFCVPVGTRNHFALDLGLDRDDPLSALDAIRDGEELLIDVGMAADRPFLNNVSFGIYAEAVHRDGYRENKEQTLAQVTAEFRRGEGASGHLRFEGPLGGQAEKVAMTLVSNNPYVYSGPPDFGRRPQLNSGSLGISAAGEGTRADGSTGSAARTWDADHLRIESDVPILAGLDGEAVVFESPLDLRIKPRALRVLVPRGTTPGYRSAAEGLMAGISELAGTAGIDT
jgi:diacylglycerol kinase family enzyme